MKAKKKKVVISSLTIALIVGLFVAFTNANGILDYNSQLGESYGLKRFDSEEKPLESEQELGQVGANAARDTSGVNKAPTIKFNQYGGEIIAGSKANVVITDPEGDKIQKIHYNWYYYVDNEVTDMVVDYKDRPTASPKTYGIAIPEEEGLYVLRVAATDVNGNK